MLPYRFHLITTGKSSSTKETFTNFHVFMMFHNHLLKYIYKLRWIKRPARQINMTWRTNVIGKLDVMPVVGFCSEYQSDSNNKAMAAKRQYEEVPLMGRNRPGLCLNFNCFFMTAELSVKHLFRVTLQFLPCEAAFIHMYSLLVRKNPDVHIS